MRDHSRRSRAQANITVSVTMVTPIFPEAAMPGTTSLKLSEELKIRVSAMAAREGKTAHAYMIETLDASTRDKEAHARFVAAALVSKRSFDESGLGYDAAEAFAHLRAKGAGKPTRKPRLKQWLK